MKGGIVLLKSCWRNKNELNRHLVLIAKRTDKSFFLVNASGNQHGWYPKWFFEDLYMEKHQSSPIAWFIERKTP